MGRTRSERGNKLPVWNNLPENFPERRKAGSRGVLSSAAVGRVGKPEKSLPGSRLKTNQRLLEGQGVLNRGKAHEKGAFFKNSFDKHRWREWGKWWRGSAPRRGRSGGSSSCRWSKPDGASSVTWTKLGFDSAWKVVFTGREEPQDEDGLGEADARK